MQKKRILVTTIEKNWAREAQKGDGASQRVRKTIVVESQWPREKIQELISQQCYIVEEDQMPVGFWI